MSTNSRNDDCVVDLDRICALLKLRGITAAQAGVLAGRSRWYLPRLFSGRRKPESCPIGFLIRLARVLKVALAELVASGQREPSVVDCSDVERIAAYLEEMGEASSVFCCSCGVDSYLVPDPLVDWSERSRLVGLGWSLDAIERRLECWKQYVAEQRAIREKSRFVHCIISPEEFFTQAFTREPEWVGSVVQALRSLDDRTALGVVPVTDWVTLNALMQRVTGFSTWDKMCVADDSLAMIRPVRELFFFYRDKPTVQRLRAGLESVSPLVPYAFPAGSPLSASMVHDSVEKASKRLKTLASERARPANRTGQGVTPYAPELSA